MATTTRARKSPEQREGELKAMHSQIVDAVKNISDDETWTVYLDWCARFHNYSFNNVLLAHMQCAGSKMSDPTRLAPFAKWRDMGHPVRKGEKGLAIYAPMLVKIKPGEDGYVEGQNKQKLIGFRKAYVWDVQQVESPETVPANPATKAYETDASGDVDPNVESGLDAFIRSLGYSVERGATGSAAGYTDPKAKKIFLTDRRDAGSAAELVTKVHEVAHVLLHCGHEGEEFDYAKHRGQAEVEAEGTAYVVARYFGIDSETHSAGYLAHWANRDADVVVKAANRITRTSKRIINAILDEI